MSGIRKYASTRDKCYSQIYILFIILLATSYLHGPTHKDFLLSLLADTTGLHSPLMLKLLSLPRSASSLSLKIMSDRELS